MSKTRPRQEPIAELKELLQSKEYKASKKWHAEKENYINNVNELLAKIKQWLKEEVSKGLIIIENKTILVNELGEYAIQCLCLRTSNTFITIRPIGCVVSGVDGAINIEIPWMTRTVCCMNNRWNYMTEGGFVNLSKNTFKEMLQESLTD